MDPEPPKYQKGHFVKCSYEYLDFYSYLYEDEDYPYFKFYGLIVDWVWEETWYNMEAVYKVYCMDGYYRFFLEDEIHLV